MWTLELMTRFTPNEATKTTCLVSVNDQKLEGIIIILFLANWQCQL
jgi:hypothetical protein